MARPALLPAPGRGSYDRTLTRAERDAEHRERLLLAAAEVLAQGPATIAKIVARAGVGRSTFYEFFDSPEHVTAQLELRALRALEAALELALREARTPLERVRALCRRWFEELEARAVESSVALSMRASNLQSLSPAGELLRAALARFLEGARAEVGWAQTADEVRLLAAAAAGEALSRRHLSGARIGDAPRVLADVIVRLLR